MNVSVYLLDGVRVERASLVLCCVFGLESNKENQPQYDPAKANI